MNTGPHHNAESAESTASDGMDQRDDVLLARLKQGVDAMIPAHWPTDYASQNKAFNLLGLMGGYVLLMTLYVMVYFWQGAAYAAWASLFFLLIQFGLIFAMQHGASFDFTRYTTLGVVFLTSSSTFLLQGAGVDGPPGVWIAFSPFAAAFITGVRQALVVLVLAIAFLVGVIVLKVMGVDYLQGPPVPDPVTMNTIHTLLILLGFSLLGLSFLVSQTLNDRAMHAARQRADKLSQAKSEFLANMSHEIRTPMNAIVGMSHLALQTDLNAKQRNHIERVHQSAQSLLGIINDILDFSKIEAGKLTMERIDFSLDEVLDTLTNLLGPKAECKQLELLYAISPDVPMRLVGDPLRLGQVLLNLGNNAVKFTHTGQIVLSIEVLQAQPGEATLQFKVQDTGIGMTQEQVGNLFQPFRQADTSTTRKYGGTGLGLAISKTLVELMQGSIQAHSAVGAGSAFVFDARFGVQPHAKVDATVPMTSLQGKRALVVDDNPAAREILVHVLHNLGMNAVTAADGDAALALALQAGRDGSHFDVVLMDWRMPGMDGIECAQRLGDLGLPHPPAVVMVTAYGYDQALGMAERGSSLIKQVMAKPVVQSVLSAKLVAALNSQGDSAATPATVLLVSERQTQAVAQLRGARILLTEDNEINQELAVELFEDAGLIVVVANHGQEALDILSKDHAFDGILMDCQMPVMDGYTATRHIRQRAELQAIPVIAMTANAMTGDKEAALASGMSDHISKPLDVEKMFVTMAKWITPRSNWEPLAAQPKSPTASVFLPRIEGIDQDFGLRVAGGNKALYRRLLTKFLHSGVNFEAQFNAALQDADGSAAMRCAHSLKGSAANLGIKRVEALAAELETACKGVDDEPRFAAIDALLRKVLLAIQPVLSALQELETHESAGSVASGMEERAANALLHQLAEQLADDDSEALTTVRTLQSASASQLPPGFDAVAELVENFEFSAALQKLQA